MIAHSDHAILVTRFHYTNVIHPKETVITGMTRDGTFLVENGRVARPLKKLRFTQSVVEALSYVLEVGVTARLTDGVVTPALRLGKFTFTS